MKKKNLKNNKGFTIADVTVAIIVIVLFIGVVYNLYIQIAETSARIQIHAMASTYSVKTLEYIDYLPYDEVTEELNTRLPEFLAYDASKYTVTISIENYKENYELVGVEKEDIIKIVTVHAKYTFRGETEEITIRKLKIKE